MVCPMAVSCSRNRLVVDAGTVAERRPAEVHHPVEALGLVVDQVLLGDHVDASRPR